MERSERVAKNNPLDLVVPGIMDAYRQPTSASAWGKAMVDAAMVGLTFAKIGNIGKAGQIGRIEEDLCAFGKAKTLQIGTNGSIAAIDPNLLKPGKLTSKNFFSSITYFEAEKLFFERFGQPKGGWEI